VRIAGTSQNTARRSTNRAEASRGGEGSSSASQGD